MKNLNLRCIFILLFGITHSVTFAQTDLNFLIGNWTLQVTTYSQADNSPIQSTATLKGYKILNNKAIQSDWTTTTPGVPFFSTAIFTSYNSNGTITWAIHTIPASVPYLSYATGSFSGQDFTGTGDGVDSKGRAFKSKFKYTNIAAKSYTYSTQISYDGGANWINTLDYTAKQ